MEYVEFNGANFLELIRFDKRIFSPEDGYGLGFFHKDFIQRITKGCFVIREDDGELHVEEHL